MSDDRCLQLENLAEALFASETALIAVLDEEGRVMRSNQAFARVAGMSVEEMVGQPFLQLFAGCAASIHGGDLAALIAGDVENIVREADWIGGNGDPRTVRWDLRRIAGSSGECLGLVAVGKDLADVRMMERQVLRSGEDEKRRLGRDLHDGLGQELAVIKLMIETIAARLVRDCPEVVRHLEIVREHLEEAMGNTRLVARGFTPLLIERAGIGPALERMAGDLETMFHIECDVRLPAEVDLPDEAATHLLRIGQEATTNAVRHGGSQRIFIELRREVGLWEFVVADDGSGFRVRREREALEGSGLQHMRYRARALGGRLDVSSEPGQGTRVRCLFPAPQ